MQENEEAPKGEDDVFKNYFTQGFAYEKILLLLRRYNDINVFTYFYTQDFERFVYEEKTLSLI